MKPCPLTRDQANAFIVEHHRHHGAVTGHRFIVGCKQDGRLVGVVVAGRPRARLIDQYRHVEISRLCTAGAENVCSFLYSRASRIAREMGFDSVFTAILESESGSSLRASGWEYAYTTRGGSQNRPSRPRVDRSPTVPKQIWAPSWCIAVVRVLSREHHGNCDCEQCAFRPHSSDDSSSGREDLNLSRLLRKV
jgi:hypothetical protein